MAPKGLSAPATRGRDRLAYDLRQWDPFRDGVRIAHELGMQISAWSTFYEETHVQLVTTKFAEEHPEYWWVGRDGMTRPTKVSFAYPEVRQYKLDLIQEQAAYGVDDVCLDFFRENHLFGERHHQIIPKQEVDENGVCIYGYEAAHRRSLSKQQYGVDPQEIPNSDDSWVSFRANYLTCLWKKSGRC